MRILSAFGSDALAGFAIAFRVMVFAFLPAWGLANAAATLVGQNLGARQPERAEASVWRAYFYNMVFLSVVGLIFVGLPGPIVAAFTNEAGVRSNAVAALRIISAGFPFYAYAMVLTNSFNGAGDTVTPTVVNVFCFWLWELPVAYGLATYSASARRGFSGLLRWRTRRWRSSAWCCSGAVDGRRRKCSFRL